MWCWDEDGNKGSKREKSGFAGMYDSARNRCLFLRLWHRKLIRVCRTDPTETGEQIRQLAGTRKSIEYGWTKEFLENRFLIVHTVSQIPGELTPEGEPYVRDRNYIMIRSVATDRWDVWDWYEPGSEVILR